MNIVLDTGAYMPERAHKDDAGLDLRTPIAFTIEPGESVAIDTGVHVAIPKGYVGMLKSKSGLNVLCGICGEGVIDAGYTGSIVAKLYNFGKIPVTIAAGEKIIQLVVLPICLEDPVIVDSLEETERGANGFGSTGK